MQKLILILIIFFGITFFSSQIKGQGVTPLSPRAFQVESLNRPDYGARMFVSGIFAGKITGLKAKKIESYENAGFDCRVPGQSIEIKAIKGGSSYIIRTGINNKSGNAVRPGQSIVGKNNGSTTISCKKCEKDDGGLLSGGEEKCEEVTFALPNITLFSTSKN